MIRNSAFINSLPVTVVIFVVLLLPVGSAGAASEQFITVADSGSYKLVLHPTGRTAGMTVSPDEFEEWQDDPFDTTLLEQATRRLYAAFVDSFDIILFMSECDTVPYGVYYGKCRRVQNSIEGIGRPVFNSTPSFGSDGKLKAVIHFPYYYGIRNGPSLHEICHIWANNAIETSLSGHWGYSASGLHFGGQLGGFSLSSFEDLGEGRYRAANGIENRKGFGTNANGGNSVPYSEMELYLMGLLPADSVPLFLVARDAEPDTAEYGVFTASSIDTITINSIISKYGEREPDCTQSQKAFRALAVIVSPGEIAQSTWEVVDSSLDEFSLPGEDRLTWGYNFWEATRGKATIAIDSLTTFLHASVGVAHSGISGAKSKPSEGMRVSLRSATASVVTFSVYNPSSAPVRISLSDCAGRERCAVTKRLCGNMAVSVPVADLAGGVYLVTVRSAFGRYTERIVVR